MSPQPQLHFRPRFRPPEHVARVRVMDTWRRLIKFQGTFGDATKINDKETLDMVPFIVRVDKICGDYCYFCPNLLALFSPPGYGYQHDNTR